jgi:hypothetical protein
MLYLFRKIFILKSTVFILEFRCKAEGQCFLHFCRVYFAEFVTTGGANCILQSLFRIITPLNVCNSRFILAPLLYYSVDSTVFTFCTS